MLTAPGGSRVVAAEALPGLLLRLLHPTAASGWAGLHLQIQKPAVISRRQQVALVH